MTKAKRETKMSQFKMETRMRRVEMEKYYLFLPEPAQQCAQSYRQESASPKKRKSIQLKVRY